LPLSSQVESSVIKSATVDLRAILTTMQPSRSSRSSTFYHGHFSPTISSPQSQDHKSLFSLCCTSPVDKLPPTLRVLYQSGASSPPSSSPSSCSDHRPVVDISYDVFHFSFLHSHLSVVLAQRAFGRTIIYSCLLACLDNLSCDFPDGAVSGQLAQLTNM